MEKTTVLITGCSSGIGLGLAARLAADAARRFKGKGVTLPRGEPAPLGVPWAGQAVPGAGWGWRGRAARWQRCPQPRSLPQCTPPCATWPRASGCWSTWGATAPTRWRSCSSTSPTRARWRPPCSRCRDSSWTCWVWLSPVPPPSLGWLGGLSGVADPPRGTGSRYQIMGGAGGPGAGGAHVQRGRSWAWGCRGSLAHQQGKAPTLLSSGTSMVLGSGQGAAVPSSPAPCPAVCNAGVGLMGPLETCSDQAMKTVFDVNLFGAIRTIQAFLPAMKRRRAGRIIVSSSIGGLQGLPFNSVYCASKFALEGLCESLAIVLRPFNIHLTLVECGPVKTSFLANLQRPDPEELQDLDAETRGLYHRYLQHCQSLFCHTAQEVEDVLQAFLEAIGTPCPPLRCVTTQLFAPLSRLRLTSPDGCAFVQAMHDFVFGRGEAGDDQP
ncbi:17-beta-hydroxysteroid dehydrogenase type 1 isoform X2 [Rissa tridactyla]|uniref:17-beta-hydroxysteroid dehydrogenase type 1 isoform X2 n=1 Tax=Rissa tridactyla TaxID=75485 RepID=UPI0023BACA1F|nr:17-beta-hydroxysteroid dehydrogenase type 1 isoform X2 [Rissa tridactyla]